ncbi:hypothetical protein K504DRAFT_453715 [Pleomassaria siparia CBS 279.74]|uniref:Uncharacterized protein n=1 Tax=Pleomassaria siparia CBS 279.74 TaxID=1314801 RepID=A0A6G1JQZ7_9PLEO|nr:hypothetical protein K504DRAFT_453715 [Pleomassaria siparia CBS 279.74]
MATFAPPPRQYPCWVPIDEIRTSVWYTIHDEITMPTSDQLRALNTHPDWILDGQGDPNQCPKICLKGDFRWARAARESYACTNRYRGILLGLNVNSYEVWGHVPRTSARCFASDAPGRAIMWLATVKDLWAKTGTQTDAGIKGNTLEERYAFAYDAVVKEAKRITT